MCSVRRQVLGQSGIEASALGFGCVRLTAQRNRREALTVLERAFAEGITHFDVARVYGFGRAEAILGEFLRGKRGQVTVATKFGLQPPTGLSGKTWVINAAKKILSPFPGLLQRAKKTGASRSRSGVFDPVSAIQSLETSLRELGTDYVDILFLHEAELSDARNQPLIDVLQRQIVRGTVRCIGIASDFAKLQDAALLPDAYRIIQFNDNVVAQNQRRLAHRDTLGLITHSIFQPASQLREAIFSRPEIACSYSAQMSADLSDAKVISSLLLQYALYSNSNGVVLFSSTSSPHIATNVRQAENPPFSADQLSKFVEFVHHLNLPRQPQDNVPPDNVRAEPPETRQAAS